MRERNSLEADIAYEMVRDSFPKSIEHVFDEHMSGEYHAHEYVYILQELSGLLFDLGFAIVSGGIVHKIFSDKNQVSKEDVNKLVDKYEATIEQLRSTLEAVEFEGDGITVLDGEDDIPFDFEESSYISDETLVECKFHESMVHELRENSPEVIFEVNKALSELANRKKS
ncbi:hypothetical protein [Vibrio harveyi]|uniref:hypothetical protein n=1 Tax=Vibrio harveyi TaxID=669 RepID=UPI002ED36748|nr:hypothetical protein V1M48_16815 [Vibrio harveyi]HDM8130353.1 hypothetical protein [Vibrio harveyi]